MASLTRRSSPIISKTISLPNDGACINVHEIWPPSMSTAELHNTTVVDSRDVCSVRHDQTNPDDAVATLSKPSCQTCVNFGYRSFKDPRLPTPLSPFIDMLRATLQSLLLTSDILRCLSRLLSPALHGRGCNTRFHGSFFIRKISRTCILLRIAQIRSLADLPQ